MLHNYVANIKWKLTYSALQTCLVCNLQISFEQMPANSKDLSNIEYSGIFLLFLCYNSLLHNLNKFWSSHKIILFHFESLGIQFSRICFKDEFRGNGKNGKGLDYIFVISQKWWVFLIGPIWVSKDAEFYGRQFAIIRSSTHPFFDLQKFKHLRKVLVKCTWNSKFYSLKMSCDFVYDRNKNYLMLCEYPQIVLNSIPIKKYCKVVLFKFIHS